MAVKLPDATALRPLGSAVSGRQIASADLSGYGKGAAAIAEGAKDIGKGISSFGSSLSAVDQKGKTENDELELARFKSQWAVASLENTSGIPTSGATADPNPVPQDDDDDADPVEAAATGADPVAAPTAVPAGVAAPVGLGVTPQAAPTTTGNPGLDERVDSLVKRRDELLAGISDPRRREIVRLSTEDDIAKARILAAKRAGAVERDAQITSLMERQDALIGRTVEEDNPEARAKAIAAHRQEIYSYVGKRWLSNGQARKIDEAFKTKYAETYADSRINKGRPDEVISAIEGAKLNAVFAPVPKPQPATPGKRSSAASPMEVAQSFVGAHERGDRAVLASFIEKAAGKRVDPAQTAWCAAFINAVLGETGQQGTGSLMARSFLNYGKPTNKPGEGDIVVLSRGGDPSKGHVGLFAGYDESGNVKVLGGNQGDRVSIASYPAARVLGFRKPPSAGDAPVKVASNDQGFVPGPQAVLQSGPVDAEQTAQVAAAPEGVQYGPQLPAPTIFDAMDPLAREKLYKRALDARDTQRKDQAAVATKQSVEAREAHELSILQAKSGRGALPAYDDIANDTRLRPEDRNTVLKQYIEAEPEIVSFNNAFDRFNRGEAFNPYDTKDRKNADRLFQSMKGDDAALSAVIQRTGILPATASTKMRADLISNDPKRVVGGMTRAANAIANNPNIMAGVDGGEDLEKNAVKFRTLVDDYGMTAEEAASRLIREQQPEFKSAVNAKIKSEDVDDLIKKRLKINDLSGQFDESILGLGRNPAVGFSVRSRDAMFDQYASLVKEHYLDTASGDWDMAKKLAAKQVSKTWGVSGINGSSVLMQYPPERAPAYNGIERAPDLIAGQAVEAIKAETGQDVDRQSLRLMPVPGLTAQAYKAGQPPPYALTWQDKSGVIQMLKPGRAFVAEPDAMRARQSADREERLNAEREAAKAGRLIGEDPRMPFGVR